MKTDLNNATKHCFHLSSSSHFQEMIHCKKILAFLTLQGDPGKLVLLGNSAGAHLASMLAIGSTRSSVQGVGWRVGNIFLIFLLEDVGISLSEFLRHVCSECVFCLMYIHIYISFKLSFFWECVDFFWEILYVLGGWNVETSPQNPQGYKNSSYDSLFHQNLVVSPGLIAISGIYCGQRFYKSWLMRSWTA